MSTPDAVDAPVVSVQSVGCSSWAVSCSRHGLLAVARRGALVPVVYLSPAAAAWTAMGHATAFHGGRTAR